MDFMELLQQYKDNPRRESAAMLLDYPALLTYCVIWKQVEVRRLTEYPTELSWAGLWECVFVDVEKIALLADDEEVKARKMVERLKGLRLVYPDGTVMRLAEQVIAKKLTDALA
ncbi:MAG: hypothetical protein JNK17_02045 [Hydrogenophaga sp.]|nr:hypothetical protein [Hydrogenophaga sp.]